MSTALATAVTTIRESLEGGRVKAPVIHAHVDWLRNHASRDETIEFFESVPPIVRHQLATLSKSAWYPVAYLVAIDRRIEEMFGQQSPDVLLEVGSYWARATLLDVRQYLRPARIHEFLRSAAVLHWQFHDGGDPEYVESAAERGTMIHRAARAYSPFLCRTTAGFYDEIVRMHGYRMTAVSERNCRCVGADDCTFEITWSD